MNSDPFLAGARALKHALDTGMITRPQYDTMYAAVASAAEADAVPCSVPGCQRAAYIGTRCAHHTDAETVRQLVQERYQ